MRVALKNLGCVKNQVDAEFLLGAISSVGHEVISDFGNAECIIVNTCGFIESAKTESIEEIFALLEHKKHGSCKIFVVTGCLAQRYAEQLRKEMPEVDAVFGIGSVDEIKHFITNNSTQRIITNKEGYFLNSADMPESLSVEDSLPIPRSLMVVIIVAHIVPYHSLEVLIGAEPMKMSFLRLRVI